MEKNLLEQLKIELIQDEGIRLKPYTDTTGHITIGVGRNLTDNGITKEECDMMLTHDAMECIRQVRHEFLFYDSLNNAQKRVIVNLCFNLGLSGLKKFERFLKALQSQDIDTACRALKYKENGELSLYYRQVGKRVDRLCDRLRQREAK